MKEHGYIVRFDGLYDSIIASMGNDYLAHVKPRIIYTWQKISHLISRDNIVVDIGVGPISALIRLLKGAEVIGLSLTDSRRKLCENYGINLRICDLETKSLPLDDESVDVVLFMEVIEHLCIWPNRVLDNIYRTLKPGGYLVVSTVNFLRISNRIRAIIGRNPLINYFEATEDGRNHVREFVLEEMSYYMKKSGFTIDKTYRFGIPGGGAIVSMLLHLAYLYPGFRNYFMIVGRK